MIMAEAVLVQDKPNPVNLQGQILLFCRTNNIVFLMKAQLAQWDWEDQKNKDAMAMISED